MYKRQQPKRGVILLIVLGMLAMFALIAITFVLLSGHARRSAVSQAKVDQANNPPDRLNDNVLMQVLRGSNNPASVLGPHGLLEDLYGNVTVEDEINSNVLPVVAGGELLSFQPTAAITNPYQHVGCVLSFTSGPAKNISTRIVGIDDSTTPASFQVLTFGDVKINPADNLAYYGGEIVGGVLVGGASLVGNGFIINGVPFSGTGFGYDPNAALPPNPATNPLLTAHDPPAPNGVDQPYALLPNPQAFTPNGTYTDPAGPGGANEDYDAADYQNMILAMMVPQAGGVAIPIPSLHRPSLLNYWFHQLAGPPANPNMSTTWNGLNDAEKLEIFLRPYGADGKLGGADDPETVYSLQPTDIPYIVNIKRRILLRPLAEDHTDFTGSNENFNPLWDGQTPSTYQWDVDNDGDGINDSIWVDVGLPVRTMRDGRQYKPLAAILCVDMDGRLNLNAHGSLAQTAAGYGSPQPITTNIVADSLSNLDVPRGQGVGPAEVDLNQLPPLAAAHPDYAPRTQYDVLLTGIPNAVPGNPDIAPGRYGGNFDDDTPGRFIDPASQLPFYDYPSSTPLAANKYFNCPGLYNVLTTFDPATNSGTMSYGTPVDLTGGACLGLDLRGQPLYVLHETVSGTGQFIGFHVGVGLRAANPYALSLSDTGRGVTRVNSADTPFSVTELEALLRPYDHDSTMLPSRIKDLAPGIGPHDHDISGGACPICGSSDPVAPPHYLEITTESWSIPCPAVALPPELRANAAVQNWFGPLRKANSLADLLRAKLVEVDSNPAPPPVFTDPNNTTQINDMETMVATLFPKEIIGGLRMDLNRPFGNGRDDNGNGVIDEPANAFDDDGDGTFNEVDAGEIQNNGIDDNGNGQIDEENEETEQFYPVGSDGTALAATSFDLLKNMDLNGDTTVDGADLDLAFQHSHARQFYARNLYVMMLTLMNFDPAHANADVDARTIAQWAVNVVDFRDRDSIMTPFEYDVNPFDGWSVDGIIADDGGVISSPDDTAAYRGLVWGCERPEMLITETLAFHDRRTENQSVDGGIIGNQGATDIDYDQEERPQGSLFVELYNPWTDQESLPGELYYTVNGHKGINLRAKVGDSPVWRMIVVEITKPDGKKTEDPDDPTLSTPVNIERSIYFIEPGFPTPAHVGDRFYPDPTDIPLISPLKPGRYAVVGPGVGPSVSSMSATYAGFRPGCVPPLSPSTPLSKYSDTRTRRIVLEPSNNADDVQVQVFGNGDDDDLHPTTAPTLAIQEPIAVVINPPEYAPNQPKRLSISEPFKTTERYPAYTDIPNEKYAPVLPDPLDAKIPANMDSDTFPQYRWIYLQRLANPLKPYDELANPYRVIDKAQVDLTAFNGLINDSADGANPDPSVTGNNLSNFFTRERGEDEESQAGQSTQPNNLWAVELDNAQPTAIAAHQQSPNQTHFFNEEFAHTLGYLNEGFGAPQPDPGKSGSPSVTTYDGSPPHPFPWLTWLNRPFLSEMEMMLVPKERSSQFLNKDSANNDKFCYPPVSVGSPYTVPTTMDLPNQPYGHLLGFFCNDDTPTAFPVTATPNRKLYRLLEYVRVPSPFVGTEMQGEPTTFSAGMHDFRPPFNHISKRRDPGRVNLNTISSENVWTGVAGEFNGPAWSSLLESRGGYVGANMFKMDNNLPTRFANPFRSFAGLYDMPDIPALQTAVTSEVNATVLRPKPDGTGGFTNKPLFQFASTSLINNTDPNPYFRYQELNRLGSTTTNRSNVYAVWVTVGYFEVTPAVNATGMPVAQFQKIYPDGFQLGQELGSDTGDITRHRSFYMIDRSIPVGFRRGEDLNAEDAILLRRFVE